MMLRRAILVVLSAILALVLGAGPSLAAEAPPPLPEPSGSAEPLDPNSDFAAQLNARIESLSQRAEALVQRVSALKQQVDTHNAAVDTHNQQDADTAAQIDTFNQQASALQTQIDAHNNQPHVFTLPQDQAAADAYQAEASQLNAQKAQLDAQRGQLQAKQQALDNEATQLQAEEDQLRAALSAVATEAQQLDAERQQLLDEIAAAEQNAESEANQATQNVDGADATSPRGQASKAPDPTEGGDSVSPKAQDDAITAYEKANNVRITPKTQLVRPTTRMTAGLTAEQRANLPEQSWYRGVIRNPDGTYSVVRVVQSGRQVPPEDYAFDQAISPERPATMIYNGSKVPVTGVVVVPEELPGHLLLGKGTGLNAMAQKVGAQTLMGDTFYWRQSVLAAINDPNVKITVSLDGMSGTTVLDKMADAIMRGSLQGAGATDWEMWQLFLGSRLPTVDFVKTSGDAVVPVRNPWG